MIGKALLLITDSIIYNRTMYGSLCFYVLVSTWWDVLIFPF